MMKRILIAILVLRGFMATGQCDLAITDFNFTTGDLVVEVINSENCGCNDLTAIGNTCENSSSPVVQNNTDVSSLVLGLHLNGIDYQYYDCLTAINHPGWTFKVKSFFGNGVLETGDTWSTNIYDFWAPTNECWAELLANQTECIELVVWQINLSQTLEIADGGWAAFPNSGNQTQNYPDIDISNNIVTMCPAVFPGCTDPFALNYNDEATEDDGTCVYSTGPDPIIIDIVVNNEECEVFEAGILSTFNYSATIVNIGTEAVTNFCLNDFLGITFNCFNGVSNLAVWIQPGDTLTVYGSINVDGTWTAGQGNYMTITSVPGEIITANNNFVFYMPDGVECEEVIDPEPCDTVYINTVDTLYIDNFITDTLYIDNFITDTLYIETIDTLYVDVEVYITDTLYITEIEYVTDTLYITTIDTVEVIVYEFLTDTIYEYITIDCETGLECVDDPGLVCPDWTSVYIPNTFTPNNDGLNDTWKMVYDLDCWVDVEFKIFNRWGNQIYQSYGDYFDSYPYWDGSINGGNSYAIDGVYTYTFYAKKLNSVEVFQRHGHITIFR